MPLTCPLVPLVGASESQVLPHEPRKGGVLDPVALARGTFLPCIPHPQHQGCSQEAREGLEQIGQLGCQLGSYPSSHRGSWFTALGNSQDRGVLCPCPTLPLTGCMTQVSPSLYVILERGLDQTIPQLTRISQGAFQELLHLSPL